jgi:hypothetical protein
LMKKKKPQLPRAGAIRRGHHFADGIIPPQPQQSRATMGDP